MSTTLNLNDLKLHLARLLANSQITIVSTIEEIRKEFPNNYQDEEIGEVLCMLIEDNNFDEVLEIDEDFYDGF